ncbi:ATP synthase F0 subunit 6 (mitochondrion) [Apis mellifera ligustica]|uniref:ATP synthase subunit a n=9 Tax=Apis mellifera TaxID=7460 RepID=ATP6_APILI|nr:ATP synthase F0 subunit 6 [Apis mellifera ligustica]YP_010295917.1 ATP synthase F0 subunit 6 [Apis mellifera carnica]Q00275.1 RecName: Full=ATP synthase subunit a; AltName: Full=F-ATPase protein 6 [Apis mellifera ligustica]ARS01174.1 ATP synthase F0 subunit 6 [Apis mellifera meda]QIC19382.1 ATP synthase F0 subunit 6 [Apis mellifera caucasica]QJC59607.1 ATP synthase F0 subunit 6 [Apis mellifera anatoliaca]QNV12185.1 ATP synthase F0 subunit 6 [Apis mellifera]BBA78478.1 ATP synthase F0 subun|eukprot:NP_008086.1 ATP synthase F0 subunit 6 (mitochondrion) [Apis mellifera ligustica]
MKLILMMNLFEMFDPSTSNNLSMNWLFMMLPIIIFPSIFWLIQSRIMFIMKTLMNFMYNEFKVVSKSKYQSNIIIFISLMLYIMITNIFSLIPYVFTLTSHLLLNMILSLTLWFSFLIYLIYNNYIMFLSHLVPLNSPVFLMNFMVIIELISLIIRPWTLSIRLSANLISGHLILTLLGIFISNFISILPINLMIQNMLLTLEIFMSMIQSYVFSILLILYFSESN